MKNRINLGALKPYVLVALTAGVLVGCGGGGGSPAPIPETPNPSPSPETTAFNAAAAQGRWTQAEWTAFILPAQTGAAEVWMVNQAASSLYKLEIPSTSKATGFKYSLTSAGPREAVAGDAALNASASPKTLAFANGNLSAFSLSQTDALAGGSVLGDISGNWFFTLAGGAVKMDATISAEGAFAASTVSDDCSYSGQVSSTTAASVYKITYQSNCQGVVSNMSGIARWQSASKLLSILSVSNDGASASLIAMQKP